MYNFSLHLLRGGVGQHWLMTGFYFWSCLFVYVVVDCIIVIMHYSVFHLVYVFYLILVYDF